MASFFLGGELDHHDVSSKKGDFAFFLDWNLFMEPYKIGVFETLKFVSKSSFLCEKTQRCARVAELQSSLNAATAPGK